MGLVLAPSILATVWSLIDLLSAIITHLKGVSAFSNLGVLLSASLLRH